MGSLSGIRLAASAKRKSSRSKPPPDPPIRCSRPFTGGRPVSACTQVARISSEVQRESPSAGGVRPSVGHRWNPSRRAWRCFSTMSGIALTPSPLVPRDAREGLPLEILLEHAPAHLAPESSNLAKAHGPEDLEELVAPRRREIHEPLHGPAVLKLREPDIRPGAVRTTRSDARLERDK